MKVKDFLLKHPLLFSYLFLSSSDPSLWPPLKKKNCFSHTFCLKALIGGEKRLKSQERMEYGLGQGRTDHMAGVNKKKSERK